MIVLQAEAEPNSRTNPYITQLFEGLRLCGVTVIGWSIARCVFGRYDVVHIHWPEFLVTKRTALRTAVSRMLILCLISRRRLAGTPLVWTVHNPIPHDALTGSGRLFYRLLTNHCDARIHLSSSTLPDRPDERDVVIRHGDYRRWYREHQKFERVPGRLLFFGLIRPYKGVEDLISAVRNLKGRRVELLLRGRALSDDYLRVIEQRSAGDPRVIIQEGFVEDRDVAAAISTATLVVLPYQHLVNSGVLLLSLSLDRPVLVPDSPAARELSALVGQKWIQTFTGQVSAQDLDDALTVAETLGAQDRPELREFAWGSVLRETVETYRRAVSARRRCGLGQ